MGNKDFYLTDLFRLTKSYEQILADHVLIEKMKYTLRQASSDCCFYEMIQEAYFQCGIILRNNICRDYFDYERFFIHRRSNFYWKEFVYLDKKTIACMVHLLLIKRKSLPDGVGWLLDCIERMICNTMENPFEKLLAQGKYKHEIDFGVRAEPLNNPIWEKVNWYDLGVEDDCTIDDIERGWVTPDDYCEHLTNSIDESTLKSGNFTQVLIFSIVVDRHSE